MTEILSHVIQSTLFAAAAWLVVLSMRRNRARTRYAVWLAASIKFLIPFALLVSAGAHLRWRVSPVIPQRAKTFVLLEAGSPAGSAIIPYLRIAPAATAAPRGSAAPVLFLFWFAGFACILTRHFADWRRVSLLVRGATPFPRGEPTTDIALLVGNGSKAQSMEPGVFGIFRPVLLLPANITDRLTPAQLDAVIAHELFHIERRDNLTAALHMLVEALFWFHPLVWWIGARLVEERERACDEAVIESGSDRHAYAEGILNVCRLCVQSPSLCVSGVTGSNLRRRIEQIMMNRAAHNLRAGKKVTLALAAFTALAFPVFIGMVNAQRLLAQAPSSAGGSKQFALASVKQNDTGAVTMITRPGPGRISVQNMPLRNLISLAWVVNYFQIEGGPEWIGSSTWDVTGTAASSSATQGEVLGMLQTLLEERFKLTIHRETREFPVYVLLPAEGGLKLPQAKASAYSMDELVRFLEGITHHVVLDQTGFQATFDFPLKADWEVHQDLRAHGPGFGPVPPSDNVFPELKEQLGLKLESRMAPVEVLVIDHAEKPADIAQTPAPAFEVVSVKPNLSGDEHMEIASTSGGRLTVRNVPLAWLIRFAWKDLSNQISGGSGWIGTARFDVMARAADSTANQGQVRLMTRALLADRFNLRLHPEDREQQIYALVTARNGVGGPNLHRTSACIAATNGMPNPDPANPPPCGAFALAPGGQLMATSVTMETFSRVLSDFTGRVVRDHTGLSGNYGFHLEWTPDQSTPGALAATAGDSDRPVTDSAGPSIFSALQEQLGLRLESTKAPVAVLVIDHAERPSEN